VIITEKQREETKGGIRVRLRNRRAKFSYTDRSTVANHKETTLIDGKEREGFSIAFLGISQETKTLWLSAIMI